MSPLALHLHNRLTRLVLEFILKPRQNHAPTAKITVGGREVPLLIVRNPRARRYLLRLRNDGSARVTIPRGGSSEAAWQFLNRNLGWLDRQIQAWEARPKEMPVWSIGTEFFFRGERVRIETHEPGYVRFADQLLRVDADAGDLRPYITAHLRRLAELELPLRAAELATFHQLSFARITVRNQRTRWGSCSRRGTISLNWRLIQTPDFVRDYICVHELAHLVHMNHSDRFWTLVARMYPDFERAEKWLRANGRLLRD